MSDPFITLWTAQERDARGLSHDELARRSRQLQRRVLRRDLIEYAAGLFVMVTFGWMAVVIPFWSMRFACAVTMLGTVIVMWNLWRRRPRDDAAALVQDAHAYYRGQLVAQRDTLASVGSWYIGPFLPGMILFVAAVGHKSVQVMPLTAALAPIALVTVSSAAVLWLVLWLNRAAARKLDQQIAALDAERASTEH
jgi:hypothetical protein